jgi:hypothetical protein
MSAVLVVIDAVGTYVCTRAGHTYHTCTYVCTYVCTYRSQAATANQARCGGISHKVRVEIGAENRQTLFRYVCMYSTKLQRPSHTITHSRKVTHKLLVLVETVTHTREPPPSSSSSRTTQSVLFDLVTWGKGAFRPTFPPLSRLHAGGSLSPLPPLPPLPPSGTETGRVWSRLVSRTREEAGFSELLRRKKINLEKELWGVWGVCVGVVASVDSGVHRWR